MEVDNEFDIDTFHVRIVSLAFYDPKLLRGLRSINGGFRPNFEIKFNDRGIIYLFDRTDRRMQLETR